MKKVIQIILNVSPLLAVATWAVYYNFATFYNYRLILIISLIFSVISIFSLWFIKNGFMSFGWRNYRYNYPKFYKILKIIVKCGFTIIFLILSYKAIRILSVLELGADHLYLQNIYTTKGYATKIDYPKLTFNYPSGWTVSEDSSLDKSFDKVKISKGNYLIEIDQEPIAGAALCIFDDSPKKNVPSADFTNVKYTEISANFGELRYFLNPESHSTNTYIFCEKDDYNDYIFPSVGYLSIVTPKTVNPRTFEEALGIIKSIKPL